MSNPLNTVGVIGAGSFGTAVSNLLAENAHVLLYERNDEIRNKIIKEGTNRNHVMHPNITLTDSLEEVAEKCYLLYPVVPSASFKKMIIDFSPYLRPDHLMIHATKGLHCEFDIDTIHPKDVNLKKIKTMSELIQQETAIVRIGCLAGPNLAAELATHQPAATVVASRFEEVIREGKATLKSDRFQVYGNKDLLGIELAGVLKNYIALASGAMSGIGYGENTRALLITRGMAEMIYIGRALGADKKAFLGLAGIGDLIATCNSPKSRNYTVGYRLAKGEKLEDIIASMNEVAEGVRTLKIAKLIVDHIGANAPLMQMMYSVFFEDLKMDKAITYLMRYPVDNDADYLDL